MRPPDNDAFGPLLHGTARAWRLKLDERLKPLGMSQARWRTLLHLARAKQPITQTELAARLGVEEPTLVNLLHRLEEAGWVRRVAAPHARRCKTVKRQARARRVIDQIDATARDLRQELIHGIRRDELEICMRVLSAVRSKAESNGRNGRAAAAKQNG